MVKEHWAGGDGGGGDQEPRTQILLTKGDWTTVNEVKCSSVKIIHSVADWYYSPCQNEIYSFQININEDRQHNGFSCC